VPKVIDDVGESVIMWILTTTRDFVIEKVEEKVKVWRLEDGKEVGELPGEIYGINTVSVTPDQKTLISAGRNQSIQLWSLKNKTLEHVFEDLNLAVNFVLAAPDGQHFVFNGTNKDGKCEEIW